MRAWLILLGGPLLWAAHFMLIYLIASVSEVIEGETAPWARLLIVAAGLICALAATWLLLRTRGADSAPLDAFWRTAARRGALLALVAILWQTLPAILPA